MTRAAASGRHDHLRALVLLATVVVVASCSVVAAPTDGRTFQPGVEHLPGPGRAAISGDPSRAPKDLVIQFADADAEIFARSETIKTGDVIEASTWSNPGRYHLLVNEVACSGDFPITGERLTEVTVRIGPTGCESFVTNIGPLPSG